MSHRKFEHPDTVPLDFFQGRQLLDDLTKPCKLTAFLGYKDGMTHIIREETCEDVTIIETPPMVVVGIIAYIKTPRGLRSLNTVWEQHLSEEVRRRFYKNLAKSKKKAFTKYSKKYETNDGKKDIQSQLEKMEKYGTIIRVLAHTQIRKMKGFIADKVDFSYGFFEKKVPTEVVFQKDEMIDNIGVTKGHPSRVSFTVDKAGQNGYHYCTEIKNTIYKIGKIEQESHTAMTEFDRTEKDITPIGGFPHYGIKMIVTLRQSLLKQTSRLALEDIKLKFIDTSSKFGHGRFHTTQEKKKYSGCVKA
ncbi:hypothetical protein MKX03_009684 [Papaver bracteatum]|nr:hypothetical protein MKX03_009684 [Papaver bracteatum]